MGHDGGPKGATSDGTDWDAAALQEWVAHVADSEAISEGEVLDRMLSALWILDEVESLMDDTDGKQLPGLDLDAVQAADTDTRDSRKQIPDTEAADSDSTGTTGGPTMSESGVDPGVLLGVVEALRGDASGDAGGDGDSRSPPSARTARLDARLDTIVDDLATIGARVDRLDERLDASTESSDADIHDQLSDLESRLDDVEADVDDQLDDQAARIEEHDETLMAHDDAIDSHAETLSAFGDTLCKHADRLSAVETTSDSMVDTQAALQESVDANFDNVDVALRFLVDRTDDVTDTVEQLESALTAERRERRRREDERRRLADLRHELANHGVTRATCENCRNDVDVSCLLKPRCPHCDRAFDGHRRRGGLFGFFATDELTTTQTGPRMQSRDRATTTTDPTPTAAPSPVDD